VSDDLNAKATVEVDFIANGLTQLISGIGQLNEQQGFSNKQNVQLEQGLSKVAAQYGINSSGARNVATAVSATATASNTAAKATQAHQTSLIATRYALYDVSNAAGIAGIALTGFAAVAYKTAIDYQADFAEVQRTTGLTGAALDALQQNLIGVSQALPASFSDITSVAALGGQLGIANSQLLEFTTDVIKFSATTNVSVNDAATAFGRLNALLPDVQGNYNGLGSSILKVGINSVATESQIITIAARIAGIGASAGLTSDQVIGLSGALASLGVQPYGASGTITRLFTKIETAVSQGGTALEAFGRVSGESGAQFQAAWASDKTTALETLFSGINAQGPGAIAAIQSLGLTSAQDLPNLLKLSQNVDLVKSSLSDAKTGLEDGTQLTDSYGIIASTVSAKIKILGNNFSALEDAIGSSSTGIGGFIDGLNDLLKKLTAISNDPITSFLLGLGVELVGITGLTLLGASALLRYAATMAAVTTAQGAAAGSGGVFAAALNIIRTATIGASTAEAGLVATTDLATGSMDGAALSSGKLSLGLKGVGVAGAALVGVGLMAEAQGWIDEFDGATKSADDLGKEIDKLNAKQISKSISTLFSNTPEPGNYGGAATIKQLNTGAGNSAADLENSALGKAGQFASSISTLGQVQGPSDLGNLKTNLASLDTELAALVSGGNGAKAKQLFDDLSKSQAAAGSSTKQIMALLPGYSAALKGTGGAAKTASDAQDAETQAVSDALSASSDALDATLKQENALYALGDSLGATGDDFSEYSNAGRTNLSDLEAVVAAVSAQTAGDAQATADNLQGLFNALTQGAKIPAAALTFLSDSIANLGVKSIVPTTFDLASLNQGLSDGTTSAAKKAGSAAASAAKQIYTLVNYGSDLSGVFTRAFDIRYSGGQALDTITSGWAAIAKAATDAAAAEGTAQAKLDSLASDKAIDEYYLTVANAYGDTLRAAQIQADLAQNASDTASANQDLSTAQDGVNKTLVGNSDAAVANRAAILGLVTDYQGYITALASSGASQATLAAKTAQLKADFISQATQLGFNKTQLGTYADSFDDVSTAIGGVPRKITVTADTNPAIQALNEFVAQAAKSGSAAGGAFGSGFSVASAAALAKQARGQILSATIAQDLALINRPDTPPQAKTYYLAEMKSLEAKLASGSFASGGYTGDGGKYQPAGIVHAGEFVFSKEATSRIGVNNLAYAHSQATRGYADGGYVSGSSSTPTGYTQLSPTDRQLLMDIRDAAASNQISKTSLAGLAASSNANSANRRVA
jgi:TP901 family phage tail tape measure protein